MKRESNYKALIIACVLYILSGIMIKYISCLSVKICDCFDTTYDRIPSSRVEAVIAFILMFFLYCVAFTVIFWGIFFYKNKSKNHWNIQTFVFVFLAICVNVLISENLYINDHFLPYIPNFPHLISNGGYPYNYIIILYFLSS